MTSQLRDSVWEGNRCGKGSGSPTNSPDTPIRAEDRSMKVFVNLSLISLGNYDLTWNREKAS